jgi:hypothetical protein
MHLRSILFAVAMLAAPAFATDHYVAPLGATATCTATGSKDCPWASIGAAFASKKIVGGDIVLLMDGDHGPVQEKYWTFDTTVTIQSQNASNARISYISFGATAKNIRLRNLKIWRDKGDSGTIYLIRSYVGSSHLTFESLDIRSREDAINYLSWSRERWVAAATRAFDLRGTFNVVRNNKITGVSDGIIAGPDSLVENNVIDGFAGDGMKGVSRSTFRNNIIKNSFAVLEGYHRDGFQSYSSGEPIVDLILEGNTIIQWAHSSSNTLTGPLQGIGMFDGWYDNLLIRNNLVVTNHSHGISVYGVRGARIVNNTVVSLSGVPGNVPYLKVRARKDGAPSQDALIANNLAMQIVATASSEFNIVLLGNSVILDPAKSFEDIKSLDYRPTTASGFVDTADIGAAPSTDILGSPRPAGAGPDRGAYEVQANVAPAPAPVEPVVDPAPVDPVISPSPIGPKRIKVKTDDPRKVPVSRRLSPTSNSAKRIILER